MADSIRSAFEKKVFQSSGGKSNPAQGLKDQDFPRFFLDDEKKELNLIWFEKKAKELAEEFYTNHLTSAQIRRFYGEVLNLEAKTETQDFQYVLPLIKMLKSKAAYAASESKSGKIPPVFRNFLDQMVDHVKDKNDFKAFKLIFETVLGFFYGVKGVR
jgi:CRISPR type III-A-associated protein Csm2